MTSTFLAIFLFLACNILYIMASIKKANKILIVLFFKHFNLFSHLHIFAKILLFQIFQMTF